MFMKKKKIRNKTEAHKRGNPPEKQKTNSTSAQTHSGHKRRQYVVCSTSHTIDTNNGDNYNNNNISTNGRGNGGNKGTVGARAEVKWQGRGKGKGRG